MPCLWPYFSLCPIGAFQWPLVGLVVLWPPENPKHSVKRYRCRPPAHPTQPGRPVILAFRNCTHDSIGQRLLELACASVRANFRSESYSV
ncbi:uncharacterized protein PHACADRAFT_258514, partial [Phanerochaete carnosa HHB-10118-sp]